MARPVRSVVLHALLALFVSLMLGSCGGGSKKALAPRTQTFGELRAIRGVITVTPPGESARPLMPRERLMDGEWVQVPDGALGWLRRDAGATLLIRGPASIAFGADDIQVESGRVFVDSPSDDVTTIKAPDGVLRLVKVRASLDVTGQHKPTETYVLSGEVRTGAGDYARAGEKMVLSKKGKASIKPAVAWVDWTGGLATTDRSAEPPPFGVGTVGARPAGSTGDPRVPLAIRRMDVSVTIENDLATTEVDQLFFNGASETMEGIYSFRTPIGASLTRFCVDRENVVVWGRVKEKKAASKQYNSHVYEGSKEDPALLEWDSPGVYRARLYPIAPGATRRVVVRYTQWLNRTGDRGQRRLYTFPMAAEGSEESLPQIEFFGATFDLRRAGAKEVRSGMNGTLEKDKVVVRAHDLVPRADLALELFDEGMSATRAYRAAHGVDEELVASSDRSSARERARNEEDYLLIPIRATDVPSPEGGLDLVVVVDTSAGMDDASLSIARAAVKALLSHLGKNDRALIWAGDATLRPVVAGWDKLRAVDEGVRRDASVGLATLNRGGATDLGAMLSEAAKSLDPSRRGAVIYLGDGQPTVGELALAELRERMAKLPRPIRTFALGVGQDANMGIIEGIAKGGFAERLGDAAMAARTALRVLEMAERPAWLGVRVDLGPHVERLVPRELDTLVADESVLLVGRLTGNVPKSIQISTPAGEKTLQVRPQRIADNGDLQARWAGGRLRQMLADGMGQAALVDLGVRTGIITPFTSLYVPTRSEMTTQEWEDLRRKQKQGEKKHRGARLKGAGDNRFALADLPLFFAGCQDMRESNSKVEVHASPAATVSAQTPSPKPKPKSEYEATGDRSAPIASRIQRTEKRKNKTQLSVELKATKLAAANEQSKAKKIAEKSAEVEPDDRMAEPTISSFEKREKYALDKLESDGGILGKGGLEHEPIGRGNLGIIGAASDETEKGFASGHGGLRRAGPQPHVMVRVTVGLLPHNIVPCAPGSTLPYAERVKLWRERLKKAGGRPAAVSAVYQTAISSCEAPIWRDRAKLQSMMLDALPTVTKRVALWRMMQGNKAVADALYRGILTRVRKPAELRELHQALGLKSVDPGMLEKLLRDTKDPAKRVAKLRKLRIQWPNDLTLALRLLESLEDAQDDGAARVLGRQLRARPDANAHVLTEVGELYLRLAQRSKAKEQKAKDEAEARRTFGEIVEYAPDEPIARRRLGDLLRAHGWFAEAARQYETLQHLSPDDTGLMLLHAASAQGLGKLDESIRWAEKVSSDGAPGDVQGLARTARALAAVYLAWGRVKAAQDNRAKEVELLRKRTNRLLAQDDRSDNNVRVVLLWSHPELHPTLWSNGLGHGLGSMMPAAEGDVTLGISQVILPKKNRPAIEVRMEKSDAAHAARLGAKAILTMIFNEGKKNEKVVTLPVKFIQGGSSTLRFTIHGSEVSQ